LFVGSDGIISNPNQNNVSSITQNWTSLKYGQWYYEITLIEFPSGEKVENSFLHVGWMTYDCNCAHANGFGFDKQSWIINPIKGTSFIPSLISINMNRSSQIY
jgi:hypothetical protein